MKLNEVFDYEEKKMLLESRELGLEDAIIQLDTLTNAYDELALLRDVFSKKDFGILIGKRNQRLTEKDIERIKRKLALIIKSNDIILSSGSKHLLWERISHGFEAVSLTALTGALGYAALFLTGPIGAVFVGTVALATAALGFNQFKMVQSLETAAKIIHMTKEYEKIAGKPRVSRWKSFMGRLKRKSPQQIEKEGRKSISRTSQMIKKDFKKLIDGLPETIPYTDDYGDEKEYPVEEFFNV